MIYVFVGGVGGEKCVFLTQRNAEERAEERRGVQREVVEEWMCSLFRWILNV